MRFIWIAVLRTRSCHDKTQDIIGECPAPTISVSRDSPLVIKNVHTVSINAQD